jgi:hypothetical protein
MAAYPRKQTVAIFILCAFAVGGVALYVYGGSVGIKTGSERGPEAAAITVQSSSVSSVDWQKQFLGMNASTSAFVATGKPVATQKNESLTAVDALGRNFFTQYAELRRSGLTTDPQTVSDAMGQVASQTIGGLSGPKVYSLKDIIVGGNGTAAVSSYGSAVMAVFKNYMPQQNEAVIAQQAFDDNDMNELAEIDPIISDYKDMVSLLIRIPVPRPLAQYHVDLINGVSIALYNAESFRHMDTDPLRGLAAVSLEVIGLQNISSALSSIQNYFISAGVPLSS